jgi:hypothetical protein
MIPPVANQIEPIASVAAPPPGQEPARTASGSDPVVVQIPRALQSASDDAPRAPVVVNDHILRLTVKPDTHEVIALVVDPVTDHVIREIPPEEMRRAAEVIRAIIGQLIDRVA